MMLFKKICRALLIVGLCWVLLWLGASTYAKFAKDIELKNPLQIFSIFWPSHDVEIDTPTIDINTPGGDTQDPSTPGNTSDPSIPSIDIDINKPDVDIDINTPNIENPEITIGIIKKENLTVEDLNKLVEQIRVVDGWETTEAYDRDKFEKPTKKFEFEGEKLTRNKYAWHISTWLIQNDETGFAYLDPYSGRIDADGKITGLLITDKDKIDYDHIIPLQYTYYHGGYAWDDAKKNAYSYDIRVGVDVSSTANRSKGAKGPSEWLPSENQDDYCYTFFVIAADYDISMTTKDINVCKLQILNAISSNDPVGLINQTILDE